MASAALEWKKDIFLYTGACSGCEETGASFIRRNIFSANRILALLGAAWRVREEGEFDPEKTLSVLKVLEEREREKEALSRRGFFNIIRSRAIGAAAVAVLEGKTGEGGGTDSLQTDSRREKRLSKERRRFLRLVKDFDGGPPAILEENGLPFYKLEVSGKCVLCNVCYDFCPTGALRKYEEGCETGLEFDISRCVRCVECEKLCTEGAITRCSHIDGLDLKNASVIKMARRELRECVDCEIKFLTDGNESKCRRCRKLERLADIRFGF
jgi:ferredoxin